MSFTSINNASGKGLIKLFMRNYIHILLCTTGALFSYLPQLHAQHADSLQHVRALGAVEVVADVVDKELQAVPVQLLSRSDIERLGFESVADAAKRMAGVQVQDYGGLGGLKTVSLRGLGAKHTMVCYDGVAVTDAQSGQVDVGRFVLDNVKELSLTAGQGDDIFQPARAFASAGTINVATARPCASSLIVKAKGGAFGQTGMSLMRERLFSNRWSYSAALNMQRATGDYPFTLVNGNDVSKRRRIGGDIKSLLAEGNLYGNFEHSSLAVKLYYYDSERGLPGAVNFYNKDNKERLWDNNLFLQSVYEADVTARLQLRALAKYSYSFSRYTDHSDAYMHGMQMDCNTQNEFYLSLGACYSFSGHWSAVLSSDMAFATLRNNFADAKNPDRLTSQSALALKYDIRRFTATVSVLATFINDRLENGASPAGKKRLSPAVSLSWQPWEGAPLRLRASCKDVFRVPTFADLYYLRMGNVGLKPERATQYNAGLLYSGRAVGGARFSFSADGYYNHVKDKIVALPTMYVWRMQNYGKVNVTGVDVTASFALPLPQNMELLADAAYSYSYAVDKSRRSSKNYGHQIPYTPRHTGSFSLTFNNPWLNVTYLLSAVGERYMLPQNTPKNRMPSYVEHSFSLNREFGIAGAKVRLQGEVLNFTDTDYEVIRYYPMPGVSWRLSATITF